MRQSCHPQSLVSIILLLSCMIWIETFTGITSPRFLLFFTTKCVRHLVDATTTLDFDPSTRHDAVGINNTRYNTVDVERSTLPYDAWWAGFPLTWETLLSPSSSSNGQPQDRRASTVHCVGENFAPDAWMYRSCQFRHLCYRSVTAPTTHTNNQNNIDNNIHPRYSSLRAQTWGIFEAVIPNETRALKKIISQLQGSTTGSKSAPGSMPLPPSHRRRDIWVSSLFSTSETDSPDEMAMALRPIPFPTSVEQYKRLFHATAWAPSTVSLNSNDHTTTMTSSTVTEGYFRLPSNVVWIPWEPDWNFLSTEKSALNGRNDSILFSTPMARWMWRDFLAIHNVLSLFGLAHDHGDGEYSAFGRQGSATSSSSHPRLLLMSRDLPPQCSNITNNNCPSQEQRNVLEKLLPLLGVHIEQVLPSEPLPPPPVDYRGQDVWSSTGTRICARRAATGLGMVASIDPRPILHANVVSPNSEVSMAHIKDTDWTHIVGRGANLRAARDWMARNLGVPIPSSVFHTIGPHRITFWWRRGYERNQSDLEASAKISIINFDRLQQLVLDSGIIGEGFVIETVDWSNLNISMQATYAAATSIFISNCGDDTVAATFLPSDATIVVFCEGESLVNQSKHVLNNLADTEVLNSLRWSRRLDWTIFSNCGYLRTHWLPSIYSDFEATDTAAFIEVLHKEMKRLLS